MQETKVIKINVINKGDNCDVNINMDGCDLADLQMALFGMLDLVGAARGLNRAEVLGALTMAAQQVEKVNGNEQH